MSTFKKAKKAQIVLGQILAHTGETDIPNNNSIIKQHLYIISDDEVKEGDWCLNYIYQDVHPCLSTFECKDCKKIIATTDNSLKIEIFGLGETAMCSLPQPSQSFIEKYVSEYNKGNVITDVLVEYEAIGNWRHAEFVHTKDIPKINPKDNTVTIKKVRDSWTRDEVRNIAHTMYFMGRDELVESRAQGKYVDTFDKWIEENL